MTYFFLMLNLNQVSAMEISDLRVSSRTTQQSLVSERAKAALKLDRVHLALRHGQRAQLHDRLKDLGLLQ